jgi:hypothetical protein
MLVSQRQLYCRPSSLPDLALRDLLRIFQNMQMDARVEVITELAARQIRLSQEEGTSFEFLPPLPDKDERGSFFSEFSEVNSAFWNLRQKLSTARHAAKQQELAYYLEGQQPDSLSSLIKSLAAADAHRVPLIVRYLTLLNLDEILSLFATSDSALRPQVRQLLATTEQDPQFVDLPPGYLDWIKTAFISPLRSADAVASQEPHRG